MALHTGEAEERDGDYFGTAVNRAARLMAVGHGGQVLASQSTADLLRDIELPLLDLGEHRLRDLSAAQRVFQVGLGTFPRLKSIDTVPSNLPTVLTELIGRSEEVDAIASLVATQRVVTLTGVGGVGKTRLALAAAAAVLPVFPDGCWLVELAPIGPGSDVVRAIAAAIGAPPQAIGSVEGLVGYLAPRRLLVVLDNCEHVIDDAADVVEAVASGAPEVRVLATSREPLGVEGEVVRRVRSLAVPLAGAGLAPSAKCAAVRLFVDRASAADDGFSLVDGNVDAVVEICRRLDGIPLAIELAAARVRGMAPAEIAARLDERFRLLTGGGRRTQERHRTLLATVTWSYELLTDVEQRVFRRLAVFPSTFDLAAAEAVATADDLAAFEVVDAVVHLVDRSLLNHDARSGRYWLLETLRQFGLDRLSEAGEGEATHDRVVGHFLRLALDAAPALQDHRFTATLARLGPELENFRMTGDWLASQGRLVELGRMASALFFFAFSAAPTDGYRWCRNASGPGGASGQDKVDLLGYAAALVEFTDSSIVPALVAEAEAVVAAEGAAPSPYALSALTTVLQFRGEHEAALTTNDAAIAAAAERGDEVAAAVLDATRLSLLAALGRTEEARQQAGGALERATRLGHGFVTGTAVLICASLPLWFLPEPDFEAGLAILGAAPDHVDPFTEMWWRQSRAFALLGTGRAGADDELSIALRLADRTGNVSGFATVVFTFSFGYALHGRLSDAALLRGYVANYADQIFSNLGRDWVYRNIDDALSSLGTAELARLQEAGRAMTRREVLALIEQSPDAG